jgi:4,5-dihydroxyphthalate decarboxylase
MVASGELAAAIGVGRVDSPDVKPLIPNAHEAEAAWYHKTGLYPINHTVVVKDSLLQADPTLAPRLFEAFKEAKEVFLRQLSTGAELSGEAQALAQRRSLVGADPLPYGLARNRKAIEAVIQFARDQKILPRQVSPEEMFASDTLNLE